MIALIRMLRGELLAMDPYAPPFAERSMVNLALNESPLQPPPAVAALLGQVDVEALVGYDTQFAGALVERLARREGVGPENIILCAGESQALALLLSCLRPSQLLVPQICWSYYATLAALHGHDVAHYPLIREAEGFALPGEQLRARLGDVSPALLLFINPHMPLGFLSEPARMLECARSLSDGLVLVDEAYADFSPRFTSVARHVREQPNLVVAKTFSKYFGLASIRVGYLVAHAELVAQLHKAQCPFHLSYLSSRLALAALDEEQTLRRNAAEIMATMDRFRDRVNGLPGVRALRSEANFMLVEFEDRGVAETVRARLHDAGVLVRSAASYGLPACLRISAGREPVMQRVCGVIAEVVGGQLREVANG